MGGFYLALLLKTRHLLSLIAGVLAPLPLLPSSLYMAIHDPPSFDDINHNVDMQDHTRRHAHVEDVPEDEEVARRYVEEYPGVVAEIIKSEKTLFEKWLQAREDLHVDEWAPFEDEEEWELFRWLIKHVGQNNIDEFLKLSIVRTASHLVFPIMLTVKP